MVWNVEDELAESIRTSATVLHGPVEMDFNAPSCESKLHKSMYIVYYILRTHVYLQAQ